MPGGIVNKMTTMVSEIGRWITMVMMLFTMCNQGPETRQSYMTDWDVWLYPELKGGGTFSSVERNPYQEEEEKLRERQNNKYMLG